MGFGIGGHHRPRRVRGAGGAQQGGIGLLVISPLLAHFEVAHAELPAFAGVVHALLQALALLLQADVQHELHHHGAGFGQQALEVVDVREPLARLLRCDPAIDHRHQHVFVMAAVENHHLAGCGHMLVDAPEVVVRAFGVRGCLPAHGMHSQCAGAAKHAANGAVFSRCVSALQHHQQLEAPVGVKQILQGVKLQRECLHGGFVFGLVAA